MNDDETSEDIAPVSGGRRHQPVERLWDDDGFRQRMTQMCRLRGIKPSAVVVRSGTSSEYMKPSPNGRNTNIIMRVAKVLDVHPAYLMFGPTVSEGPAAPQEVANPATAEQRLAMIAQMCASHWLRALLDTATASAAADALLRDVAALTLAKPI